MDMPAFDNDLKKKPEDMRLLDRFKIMKTEYEHLDHQGNRVISNPKEYEKMKKEQGGFFETVAMNNSRRNEGEGIINALQVDITPSTGVAFKAFQINGFDVE